MQPFLLFLFLIIFFSTSLCAGRFDEAISAYHKSLAFQPTFSFAAEMLTRAMQDRLSVGEPSEPFAPVSVSSAFGGGRDDSGNPLGFFEDVSAISFSRVAGRLSVSSVSY